MRKILLALSVLMSVPSVAYANEYLRDSYPGYGFASPATVLGLTSLKAGLRGAHVSPIHHRENFYYPGNASTPRRECD